MSFKTKIPAAFLAAYASISAIAPYNLPSNLEHIAYSSETQAQQQSAQSNQSNKPKEAKKISYSEMKKALGSRLEKITQEQESQIIKNWGETDSDEQEAIYRIYAEPEKLYKIFPEKYQKEYDNFKAKFKKTNKNKFKLDKLDDKDLQQIKDYEKEIGWRIIPRNKELEESDIMMLYYIKKMSSISFP